MDDAYFPVCSPRYAKGRPPRAPADLASHTLLRADDEMWKAWFDAAGLDWPEPTRGTVFNDSALMLQAAADGQGIALARSSLIGNDLHNGILVRLFDVVYRGPRKLFLVYPPRAANAAKVGYFRAWLKDEVAADAKRADLAFLKEPRTSPQRRRATISGDAPPSADGARQRREIATTGARCDSRSDDRARNQRLPAAPGGAG